jgi:hypothetical protein
MADKGIGMIEVIISKRRSDDAAVKVQALQALTLLNSGRIQDGDVEIRRESDGGYRVFAQGTNFKVTNFSLVETTSVA